MINRESVLLLQAPVPGPHNRLIIKPMAIPPLGLGYIASVLLRDGFEVKIVDMDMEDIDVEEFQQILHTFKPAVIGISTTTLTYKNGLRVAKVAKETSPESLICMGGPHVSALPYQPLKYHFVDAVIQGEGEFAFLELCRTFTPGQTLSCKIPGLVLRQDGRAVLTARQERITDLDQLPFPARHSMPLNLYNIPGTLLTSRGCPFGCGFCAGPVVMGKQYVARSAANVIKEVQMCVELFNLTSFYFVDDTMTHDIQRLLDICQGMRRIKIPPELGRQLKWTCESRADVASLELLQEMKDSGCTTIQFGMESGSQELLDRLGKKVTLKQIEQAVVWSREAGINTVLSMVFPHPDETEATMRQTFDFIRRLKDLGVGKIIPSLLTLFPGTRFAAQKDQLGITILTEDTDEYNLSTPILTTRNLDLKAIINGHSRLLMLTQDYETV